jgi:hypothetical protein
MEAGTSTNQYYSSYYTVTETFAGSGIGSVNVNTFTTPTRSFAFNQVVTFSSLETPGSTSINGNNITTGVILSDDYVSQAGSVFSAAGMAINLDALSIETPSFAIDGNGDAYFSAGLVNITSNVITFGASDSSYSQTGKIRFNNSSGTQIGELKTSSGVAGGAPRSTITLETSGGGTGLDPVLSLRSGYGWDIGDSNMGTIYGYRVGGVNKLNLFADTVLLNSGPFLSSTGYQRIWGNFTIQWVRRTYTSEQQVPYNNSFWPVAFTTIFGAVISKGNAATSLLPSYQEQNEAATVSYNNTYYLVDLNNSAGGTFFIIALGMIADPT